MIAVLPTLLMPFSHARGEDFAFLLVVYLGSAALLLVALLMNGLYMRRTPLVRIDETSLIFFGNARSEQRVFQRHAISRIGLSANPSFWRSAFCLSVTMDGETVKLWIPQSCAGSVASLERALREQFPGKFEKIAT
jgi:hypothetical protein